VVRYFKNDSDLIELVREATKMRLSYKHAVSWIKEEGYDISEKKFYRIKKMLEKKHREIMTKLHGDKQLEFNAEAVVTLSAVRKEMIAMLSDKKLKPWERIKAAEAVSQNLKDAVMFYDAAPIVKKLAEKSMINPFESKEQTEEKNNGDDDSEDDNTAVTSNGDTATTDDSDTSTPSNGYLLPQYHGSIDDNKNDDKSSLENNSKITVENSGETGIPNKEEENGKTLEEHPESPTK